MILPTVQTIYRDHNPIETQRENLLRLIGKKHEARVKVLPKGTFDPTLWRLLNQPGPCNYHYDVKEELLQGYLWVQEDSMAFNVLWSNAAGFIFRAFLHRLGKKKVIIECYSSHIVNVSISSAQVSVEGFTEMIDECLRVDPLNRTKIERSEQARLFEKRMELLPLIFKISKAATAYFVELIRKCPFDLNVFVVLGTDDENNIFNPKESKGITLIEISKQFLIGRLCYLHHKEQRLSHFVEPVAPVLRSLEAFSQLKALRMGDQEDQNDNDGNKVFQLDLERVVSRKFPEFVTTRTLKDLKAYLIITQGCEYVSETFKITNVSKAEKEWLEFSIDFNHDQWLLEQKVIEQ